MQLGRKDLIWTYAATSMRLISGACILPFSLKMFPSEEMGVWQIFLQFITVPAILDFGFANSFVRNITYVFSGAKELRTTGFGTTPTDSEIDYGLLKSLLRAMRFFYGVLAVIFLLLFTVAGSFYLHSILKSYSGDTTNIWVAWLLFGGALAYEVYTYYYNAILVGRGQVKTSQKITILAQSTRIVVTIALLLLGLKLLALVIGLLAADIISRSIATRMFYDRHTKDRLAAASVTMPVRKTIKTLAPNAFKVGIMTVGVFLRQKAIVLIAPYFLPLSLIASFGTSKQIIDMISGLGNAWWGAFHPQATQYTMQNRKDDLKRMYIKSIGAALLSFVVLGTAFVLTGNIILDFINSKTFLLPQFCLIVMLIFSFLDLTQAISSGFLLVGNQVPFYKSNLVAGALTVGILLLMFYFTNLGVWSLILSSGLAMSVYLFWKWPVVVIRDLEIKFSDILMTIKNTHR
ncbi:MAG: hypothetical protein LBV75_05665 [Paludibacter sp.]|jgi:O-antigen/teichoic acid export membrane protein|nr:hypothetical protein [Paludibacter sp.]